MKSNDSAINMNLSTQNDNKLLISRSISRQLSLNASINNLMNSIKQQQQQQPIIRAYKRRFLMITLSLLLCISNAFQWIEFASVSDKLIIYYNISNLQVNLLSITYFVVYVTCIVFAIRIIELKGLRYSILLAAFLNFAGSLIKCASVNESIGFYIALVGQFFSALGCLLIFNIPPEVAANYFKPKEVSRVVSLEVCSCFIGNAIAFFVPVYMVGHLKEIKDIGNGFLNLYLSAMIINAIILILIIFLFEEKPPHPPSMAQFLRLNAIKDCEVKESTSIIELLKNRNLVNFIIFSSINAGIFDALATLLNTMILKEYPGDNQLVSSIGMLFILSGMIGSLFCGYLLDKLHKYKEISLVFYVLSIFFLIQFAFKLHLSSPLLQSTQQPMALDNILLHVYVSGMGIFMIGFWTIRFDFGPELAYPVNSSTVCGLTAASCDIFGTIITLITTKILDNYSTLYANLFLILLLNIGLGLICLIKPEYKRQEANNLKPLINDNNNNQMNSNYGTLDNDLNQLINQSTKSRFTNSTTRKQSYKIEYTNNAFSNAILVS